MRNWSRIAAVVLIGAGCHAPPAAHADRTMLDAAHSAAIVDSVRELASAVERDVSRDGPRAWRSYFADDPAFFMAAQGRLVFPTSDSAARAIGTLERLIARIELRWGSDLRVDPLAPGLAVLAASYHETRVDQSGRRVEEDGFFTGIAEHRADGWRLRSAHWSVAAPASAVP